MNMLKFLKEFKEFAVKGNMIQIAIGVIIGAAFNKLIEVMVKEVFMPPLTLFTPRGNNWENKNIVLREGTTDEFGNVVVEEVVLGYGHLIQALVDFVIIAFVVFLVIKFMNRLTIKAEDVKDTSVETPKDIELLYRVTELLEQQNEILKEQKKV
jgi:large conductance mechanosensitive channel